MPGFVPVLCLGADIIGSVLALETVEAWVTTDVLTDVPEYAARADEVRGIAERHVRGDL